MNALAPVVGGRGGVKFVTAEGAATLLAFAGP